jgi:hypothetical protein
MKSKIIFQNAFRRILSLKKYGKKAANKNINLLGDEKSLEFLSKILLIDNENDLSVCYFL